MTRLSYQIPNFTYPDTGSDRLFGAIAAQAVEAESSGFDTVLLMDHFYQLPGLGAPTEPMLEAYTLLGALAMIGCGGGSSPSSSTPAPAAERHICR